MSDELLAIDEQPDRYVRLFGERYFLRRRTDLSHVQEIRFLELFRRVAPLINAAAAGAPVDEASLNADTRELCALACDAPADVLARLKDLHCGQIVQLAFFDELLASLQKTAPPSAPGATPPAPARPSTKRSRH